MPRGGRTAGRLFTLLAVATTLGALAPAAVPAASAAAPGPASVERVLVLALPGLTWADVEDGGVPHLRRLADRGAVANLSSRAPKLKVDLAGSYVTFGAGDKSVGAGVTDLDLEPDGAAFEVDERLGAGTAGEAFRRRTGTAPRRGLVHLGVAETRAANDASAFGAEIGRLGDALGAAGFSRAVIANADGRETRDDGGTARRYHREAVSALMGSDGTVPGGRIDAGLLGADPNAPFGTRLDEDAVTAAFTEAFRPHSVVLVEASDLVRADAYASVVTPEQHRRLRAQALRRTDALVARLLEHVDPERDAVLLVGTAPPSGETALPVAAIVSPGIEPGLLRSGTTQRSGFVQLMDAGPTVLDLVGVARPDSMRGRPMTVGDRGGDGASRRAFLVDVDEAARFRATVVDPVAIAFIALQVVLVAVTLLALTGRSRHVAGRLVPVLGSLALGVVPAVYLARLLPLHDLGAPAYWAFLVAVTAGIAAFVGLLARDRAVDRLVLGLGAVTGILVLDGLLGSPLQLNSALGFSPEVAGRFIGYGNAGYAALAGSAILLAGLAAHRLGSPGGRWVGVAILGVALVVDGAPFWGADVGGVLSMVPAYGVTAALLLGWRVRPPASSTPDPDGSGAVRAGPLRHVRNAALFAGAAALAIAGAAALDLQRPAEQRTHLGRLVEQVRGEGAGELGVVIGRKLEMNLASLSSSVWRLLVPVALGFVAYLAFGRAHALARLLRRIPELRAALLGFAILIVLGYALNDTGILVPAIMLGMCVPVLAVLTTWGDSSAP
ncbi:MAG: hypothetical protein FJW88_12060 [Actinobacteria bacterium]|nr:hypothetical protein [Actinomycetota bacterium]